MSIKVQVLTLTSRQAMVAFYTAPVLHDDETFEEAPWELAGILTMPALNWDHLKQLLYHGRAEAPCPVDQVMIDGD